MAYDFILARVGGKKRMEEDGLVYWRTRILAALITTGLVLGFLGFIPLTFLVVNEGLWRLALIDVSAWVVGLSLLVAPGMRYETRAGITLTILYLVGIFIIINVGLLSGGPFLIFIFAVLTGVLLGTRTALAALLINTITLVVICWLMASGQLNGAFPFFETTEKMLAAGTTIILANAIATISLAVLVKGLANSAWKEKSMAQALEKERSQLLAAKRDLELEITERRSIESALRESERKYRDLFSNLPIGIGVTDMEGRLLDYNEALLKPGGYVPADVESLGSINSLYYDPAEREKILKLVSDQGALDGFELRLKKKDGTFYHALLSLRQIAINNQACWHAGIIDITERKKAEEALRKSEKRLEEQLRHAQRMEAMGTLAGGIAHGFNNLLMGIQGSNSLLMDALGPDSLHFENLARIEEQVRQASSLTKQILGLAQGGKYEVKVVDPHLLIEKSLDLFGRTRQDISIHHRLHEKLWAIEADQEQIERVFLEIYANAGNAMPGGGEMSVTAENQVLDPSSAPAYQVPPGRYISISIADTGVGMDKDTRERIFDPFFTTKDMAHETGLGLASAYGIIKNHSGTITVDSQKDQGTVFTILLPASDLEPAKEISQIDIAKKGSATVLLVDDEEMLIEVGSQMLEAMGYQVLTAGGGEQALAVYSAERARIDLVILDMMMPGMNGRDTFKALKEVDPAVRVLLSSGYSQDGQATEILNMGCRGFIQKPFNMRELSDKVTAVLK